MAAGYKIATGESRSKPCVLFNLILHFGIATFVRLVKGRSSRLLRQEFPKLKCCWGVLENHWNGDLLDSVEAVVNFARSI
jgi:REP element-mobilizing transposase RayT